MTTVAYAKGIMAADTQMTFGDATKARVSKIVRLTDGSLFACAGSQSQNARLKAWALEGFIPENRPRFGPKAEVEALLIKPDGTIWYYDGSAIPDKLEDKFYAIGSGGAYALGAMACGRSAAQAVRIAARYDSTTSEPIDKMELQCPK